MVRAPCCEKVGLKKGPWTPQEDHILTSYIRKHGHGNWRSLPKQSGLLRCGKSCRLRWMNYLRPDIKRGNFTDEEEETIIKLHETLGNRWSAIAAKLPGRTDNEIKNVWHTHLRKKLLKTNQANSDTKRVPKSETKQSDSDSDSSSNSSTLTHSEMDATSASCTSSRDFSLVTVNTEGRNEGMETMLPEIDDKGSTAMPSNSWAVSNELPPQCPIDLVETFQQSCGHGSDFDDGMDFWYDLFIRCGDSNELPEF